MSYRIEYQEMQKKHDNLRNQLRLPVMIVLCFVLFLFFVETMWPDGAALMQKLSVYTKEVITVSALNDMANELHYGESLVTAISNFCGKMVS